MYRYVCMTESISCTPEKRYCKPATLQLRKKKKRKPNKQTKSQTQQLLKRMKVSTWDRKAEGGGVMGPARSLGNLPHGASLTLGVSAESLWGPEFRILECSRKASVQQRETRRGSCLPGALKTGGPVPSQEPAPSAWRSGRQSPGHQLTLCLQSLCLFLQKRALFHFVLIQPLVGELKS